MVDPNNPNLYVYGANNPLRFTDPTGNFTLEFNSSWDDWRNWWSGLWSGKQTKDSSQKQSGSSEKNSIVNNKRKSEPSQPVTRQQYFGDQPQGEPVRYQEFPGPPPVSFPVYNLDQLPQSEQWKYVNQIDSNNREIMYIPPGMENAKVSSNFTVSEFMSDVAKKDQNGDFVKDAQSHVISAGKDRFMRLNPQLPEQLEVIRAENGNKPMAG